jgi:DnaJ-domain-containing protein 1
VDGAAAKTWIELELVGFTDEVVARMKAMMTGAELPEDPTPPPLTASPVGRAPARAGTTPPPPPPSGHELPRDEGQLFMHLTEELRRLRQLAVHEVLDVDRDADADAIRVGWMRRVRRYHPDLVARHHAPAISHLAEELTILCNRAYDRLRAALVLEGRATSVGSSLQQPAGWLVGFDDIPSRGTSSRLDAVSGEIDLPAEAAPGRGDPDADEPPSIVQGGETFETRARLMLSSGDAAHAQEVLAAALCVYPRSRPLRSLYYVASALAGLMKGERMLAMSQLETALAHYEHCVEAAQILDYLRRNVHADDAELRRFFQ